MNDFNFRVSLSTSKIDKNQKGIWAKVAYQDTTITLPNFISKLGEGYAFAHLFMHSGTTFNYKERLNCNYKGSQVVSIDIDHTTLSFAEFNDMMAITEVKPSITYTTQNNGIKGNRYRALYIVDEVMSGEVYKEIYSHLTSEIESYSNGEIKSDNNANKLNQQFAGNGTENFEYNEGEIYSLQWLLDRYDITTSYDNQGGQGGYIISHVNVKNEKPHDRYIISPDRYNNNNDNDTCVSSSCVNVHDDCLNDIDNLMNEFNKHGRYIHYLFYKKQLEKNPHDRYIINTKKREEHYITTVRFFEDNEFINDYYDLSIQNLYSKYLYTYPSIECSFVEYDENELWYYVPKDYLEIKRKWHIEEVEKYNGTTYKVSVIEKAKNGQGRRHQLFLNLIIRRLINPSISFEHLLFNGIYELYNHINNNDESDVITKIDIATIAVNAYCEDLAKWQKLKEYYKPKWKINKDYCIMHHLNARREAIKVRGMLNKQKKELRWREIEKYYNPQLKERENLEILKANGVDISLRSLQVWKKENGYTKKKRITANKKSNISVTKKSNECIINSGNITQNAKNNNQNKAILRAENNKDISSIKPNKIMRDKPNMEEIKRVSDNNTIDGITLSDMRILLMEGDTLNLKNNIIALYAGTNANFDIDALRFLSCLTNIDISPSISLLGEKYDEVILLYAVDSALNDENYRIITQGIIDEVDSITKTKLEPYKESIRKGNMGILNNDIVYNNQWLINRYDIIDNQGGQCGYIISHVNNDDELNEFGKYYQNNDFLSNSKL